MVNLSYKHEIEFRKDLDLSITLVDVCINTFIEFFIIIIAPKLPIDTNVIILFRCESWFISY